MSKKPINNATEYLTNGGLFNPESMDHEKVRDLIYQMRNEIAALKKELTARGERMWIKCEERIPEKEDQYMVWDIGFGRCGPSISLAMFIRESGWFGIHVHPSRISHWSPLPEGPQI